MEEGVTIKFLVPVWSFCNSSPFFKLQKPPSEMPFNSILFHHFYLSTQILTIIVLILMLHKILHAKLSKAVVSLILINSYALFYMFGYIMEHTSKNLDVMCFCVKVEYIGQYGLIISVLWFFDIFFNCKYRRWLYFLVTVGGGFCILAVCTLENNQLFYESVNIADYGTYAMLRLTPGILYKLFYCIDLLIFVRIEVFGIRKLKSSEGLERRRNKLIVTSPLYPLLAILVKWTGISKEYDLMAFGILGFVGSLTIAIIRYDYFETIRNDMECDPLTGVSCRDYFENRIQMYLKDGICGAFFMLDLDNFKEINDTYGHLEGDNVLISLANTLKKMTEDEYAITRMGGDEFSLFIPQVVNEGELEVISKRIIEEFKAEQKRKGLRCCCSCSIGIAIYNGVPDVNFIRLYENADKALYFSKKSGKGKWKIF